MANEVAQARRSAAKPRPVQPNARALTAAAMKLDPTDLREARRVKGYRQDWQRYAWDFYRQLPIVHYGHDYYGNVCSRVRLYAGFQSDPDDPPIPLDDLGPDDEQPEGSTAGTTEAAVDEMRRLDQASDGGLPGIAGDFAVNLSLVGECFLYGRQDANSPTGETFAVYSTEEFKSGDTGYSIHRHGATMGEPVQPDDYVLRVWRRLRQFRDMADAPMMALLDDCDNLLTLTRVLKAISNSRIHGGIFVTPSEWHFPAQATDSNANGQAADIPLVEQIKISFTTPITDPSSVASVVPMHLEGPADTLDKARFIDFGRGYGDDIIKQIEGVKQGIALGLDLPIEVVLGHMNTTFANAWQIAEETFKAHIEPLVQVICRALTDGYLWPALEARGLDPTGYSVWYDPSALIGHTDLFANMEKMHLAYAVSDDALRRAGGANDDDAPEEDEIKRRIYIAQQLRVTERITDPNASIVVQPPSDLAGAGNAPPSGVTEKPSAGQSTPSAPALTAAGARTPLDQLGPRLTQIDQDLRARVQTLADSALQRALERAGAMIARKSRPGRQSSGKLNVKLSELAQHLGAEHVLALGLTEDRLIDGELGELESEYRKLTKRALAAALLAGRRAVPDGDLSDTQVETLTVRQETWIAGGFAILSAAVLNAAHAELFTPAAVPVGPGELDLSARVSPAAVRESLAVAGGAPASTGATDSGAPPGGVATGEIVMSAFRDALQILPVGWQWVYGYPDRPFEPHEQLEGQEFSSWEDDVLANDQDWPDVQWYRPGDHTGCVVAGTIVAGQVPSATTLRWYEGAVIELATASGEQLTITPNHPVLTDRGWVKAERLVEGDHVVRCLDPGATADLIPDENQAPARVEDLFAARWVGPDVVAACVPVAAEDFHGDGFGSEITVVCAHRDLMADGHTAIPEPLGERGLAETAGLAERLASASAAFSGLDRVGPSTLGIMRSGSHRLAVLRRGTSVSEELSLPVAAWRIPAADKTTSERRPAHAEVLGHGEQAFPSEVELDKLIYVNRRSQFAGHVFNLHTDLEWYTANRLIVHNCECLFIAMFASDRGDNEPPPEEG